MCRAQNSVMWCPFRYCGGLLLSKPASIKPTHEHAIRATQPGPKGPAVASTLVARHKWFLLHNHNFAEGLPTELPPKKSAEAPAGELLPQHQRRPEHSGGLHGIPPRFTTSKIKTCKRGLLTPFFYTAPSLRIPPLLQAAASPVLDTLCKEAHFASILGLGLSVQCKAAHATLRPHPSAHGCTGTSWHFDPCRLRSAGPSASEQREAWHSLLAT